MENKTKVFIALTLIFAFVTVVLSITVILLIKNPAAIIQMPEKTSNLGEAKTQENMPAKSETVIPKSEYNYTLSKRKEHQAVREGYLEVFVDTDGNAYIYTIGDTDTLEDAQVKSNLKKVEKQFSTYSPKNYDNYGDKSISAYKLDLSKVLTVYNVGMGNGGFRYFVFVKENGEISYLNYDSIIYEGQINVKNVSNLKNVVSIVDNEYTQTPYAITLDGNEISLYDYMK